MSSNPNDEYRPSDDPGAESAAGADTAQDDYKSRTGQSHIPVQSDSAPVDDPIDGAKADSDEQLGKCNPLRMGMSTDTQQLRTTKML